MSISKVTPGSTGLPINLPLGTGGESGVNANGGVGLVKIAGLSSDIPISTAPVILLTAFGGDIEILNAFLMTDATGIVAAGANIRLTQDGPIGSTVWFSTAASGLGAQNTLDLNTASVTKQRTIIQQGNHILLSSSTTTPGSGGGAWNIYIDYRPMASSASLA